MLKPWYMYLGIGFNICSHEVLSDLKLLYTWPTKFLRRREKGQKMRKLAWEWGTDIA